MASIHVLWRRIDAPGRDACRIRLDFRGARLLGHSEFVEDGQPFRLRYAVSTDARLRTTRAVVEGYAGTQPVRLDIRRSAEGRWTLAEVEQQDVFGCEDVDLAFTPATNLLPLRRLRLAIGQAAPSPAAYLELASSRLTLLPQFYKRLSRGTYRYEAPTFGYGGTLWVSRLGVVLRYPGLFEAQAVSEHHARSGRTDYSPSQ